MTEKTVHNDHAALHQSVQALGRDTYSTVGRLPFAGE